MDNPFSGLVNIWLSKIDAAWDKKAERFGKDAADALFFYKGPYDAMYTGAAGGLQSRFFGTAAEGQTASIAPPTFRMTLNKVAELVQIFGPNLYYKNPQRQVTPRTQVGTSTDLLADAMGAYPQYGQLLQMLLQQSVATNAEDKTRALLVEALLNATPDPLDLKTESRQAIDEALIKGMGCCWTHHFQPPAAGHWVVGSFYDSCDNLGIDPDATSWKTAKWIFRRWIQPVWEVERKFQLPPGSVKAQMESRNRQAEVAGMGLDGSLARLNGKTCDYCVYYEIFSKTGVGGRLKGAADDGFTQSVADSLAGDYAYLVVCPGTEYPLNIPPAMLDAPGDTASLDKVKQALQWPTPFYVDGGWPVAPLYFHETPNEVWPVGHITFAMGELKFLNWGYSWLASKIRTTCRDFIALKKALNDEFKQKIMSGEDLTLLEIEQQHGTISEIVQFLQHPPMNQDIFTILQMIEQKFDERTGLTEIMYGQSGRQYRSAAEAEIKKEQSNIRPDDMANRVEDWQTKIARMEAVSSRWHLKGQDVMPFLGKPGAALWQMLVADAPPQAVMYDLQYRVEAGSIRKPNRSRDAENFNAVLQNLLPLFQQVMTITGNVDPINAILAGWAKTMDMDPALIALPPLMPPPMPPQPGMAGPAPGQPQIAA